MVDWFKSFISATEFAGLRSETLRVWALSLGFALLAIGLLYFKIRRTWKRRRKQRRARRAQDAEALASSVLRGAGYRVIEEQVRMQWVVLADGQRSSFTLIADYLVTKWGRKWVAEVKTGERALALQHGPTRRQLLEYLVAFDVRGVLLVDSERGRVKKVSFPHLKTGISVFHGLVALGSAVVVGVLIGWVTR